MATPIDGIFPNFHDAFTQLHLGQLIASNKCTIRDRRDGGIDTKADHILQNIVSTQATRVDEDDDLGIHRQVREAVPVDGMRRPLLIVASRGCPFDIAFLHDATLGAAVACHHKLWVGGRAMASSSTTSVSFYVVHLQSGDDHGRQHPGYENSSVPAS